MAAVIGPSKVRLVLLEAGLVKPVAAEPKAAANVTVVHARRPEQTVNIGLCVVPVSHEATTELVSTSVAAAASGTFSPSYAEQMSAYAQQKAAKCRERRQ